MPFCSLLFFCNFFAFAVIVNFFFFVALCYYYFILFFVRDGEARMHGKQITIRRYFIGCQSTGLYAYRQEMGNKRTNDEH